MSVRRLARRALSHPTVRSFVPYVLLSAGVFCAAAVVGAAAGVESGGGAGLPVRDRGTAVPDRSALWYLGHDGLVGLRMAGGVVLGGLPTLSLLLFNGALLGAAVADAAQHLGSARALALVVPHGVFELPAVWLFGAIGFRWLHAAWTLASGGGDGRALPTLLGRTLGGLTVGFCLLAVAGAVEGTVTVPLARSITAVHPL